MGIIGVSRGFFGSESKQLRSIKGYFVPQAYETKKAVAVPVVGVGESLKLSMLTDLFDTQACTLDLVAVGRALWKDPKWVEKPSNR